MPIFQCKNCLASKSFNDTQQVKMQLIIIIINQISIKVSIGLVYDAFNLLLSEYDAILL